MVNPYFRLKGRQGMFITLTAAPDHPASWIMSFLLFRLFDVTKPFPCSWFDQHIHGGIGIMIWQLPISFPGQRRQDLA
jgi:phosphatidylglycerophosphatase A